MRFVALIALVAVGCSAKPAPKPELQPVPDRAPEKPAAPTGTELVALGYQKLETPPRFPYKPEDRPPVISAAAKLFLEACDKGHEPGCWLALYTESMSVGDKTTAAERVAANCHRGHVLSCRALLDFSHDVNSESAQDYCRRGIGVLCESVEEACRLRSAEACSTLADELEEAGADAKLARRRHYDARDWECQKLQSAEACRDAEDDPEDDRSKPLSPATINLALENCRHGIIEDCSILVGFLPGTMPPWSSWSTDELPRSAKLSEYVDAVDRYCLFKNISCPPVGGLHLEQGRSHLAEIAFGRACQANAPYCLPLLQIYRDRGEAGKARDLIEYVCNQRKYKAATRRDQACELLTRRPLDSFTN